MGKWEKSSSGVTACSVSNSSATSVPIYRQSKPLFTTKMPISSETDEFLREALSMIDGQFRTIHSLKTIVVQVIVYDGVVTTSAKDIMKELGWVVVAEKGRENGIHA